MKTISFLLKFLAVIIATGFSVLVMIYGWGLEPKSWLWILLITPVAQIIALVFIFAGQALEGGKP